jgi:hypothetical protein
VKRRTPYLPPASSEFAGAKLGDARRTRRLKAIAETAATAPSMSFPKMSSSDGELEGIYRFLSNGAVDAASILEPHIAMTAQRSRDVDRVLVLHDTTSFQFPSEVGREGLGWIQKEEGAEGFFGHFAFAVAADAVRTPLGVVGLSTVVREGAPLGRKKARETRYQPREKESARWTELARAVHLRMPDAIHVMDREADMFHLYDALQSVGASFVIRMRETNSRVAVENGSRVPVVEVVSGTPVRLSRDVNLSHRKQDKLAARNRFHPPRRTRTAQLEVRACAVTLPRPAHSSERELSKEIPANVVWVNEVGQPAGEVPVVWLLVTNLPIASEQDLERVVDAYCARWVIEEFFKALKTGCAFEKRQLESLHALLNALAVFSVIAYRLLLLRTLAREKGDVPADRVLSNRQLELLRAVSKLDDNRFKRIKLPASPTAVDALLAVAGLGGHIKNNGIPGWQVLGRGYDAMLLLELGWRARDAM